MRASQRVRYRADQRDAAAEELAQAGLADKCRLFALDVTDPAAYAEVVREAKAALGLSSPTSGRVGVPRLAMSEIITPPSSSDRPLLASKPICRPQIAFGSRSGEK